MARLADLEASYQQLLDPWAIAWLQTHCVSMAEFFVVPHVSPAPCPDHAFDLAYSISVFTHLPEDMQFHWLEELRRITRPESPRLNGWFTPPRPSHSRTHLAVNSLPLLLPPPAKSAPLACWSPDPLSGGGAVYEAAGEHPQISPSAPILIVRFAPD